MPPDKNASGARFFRAVEAVAITQAEAKKAVQKHLSQSQKRYPDDSASQHQDRIAEKIILAETGS